MALRRELKWNETFTTQREGISITPIEYDAKNNTITFILDEHGYEERCVNDLNFWYDYDRIGIKFQVETLRNEHARNKYKVKPVLIAEPPK